MVELHEDLLEVRPAVMRGPRFCPHFVGREADHQSGGNPAQPATVWIGSRSATLFPCRLGLKNRTKPDKNTLTQHSNNIAV